jgi:hypothetical protein
MTSERRTTALGWSLCEAAAVLPDEPECRRLARWTCLALDNLQLCHYHAEPFLADPGAPFLRAIIEDGWSVDDH